MARDWEGNYKQNELPWDTDVPSEALTEVVHRLSLSGVALEVGCGTGAHALWLAQQGFRVIGVDVSPTAIDRAKARAAAAGISVDLRVADFLEQAPVKDADMVFDRGVFHCMAPEQRDRYTAHVADALSPSGVWVTVAGNADEQTPGEGPPRLTAAELVAAVEPRFRIAELTALSFGPARIKEPLAWRLVARPRD